MVQTGAAAAAAIRCHFKQRSSSSHLLGYSLRGVIFSLITFVLVLLVLQVQLLQRPSPFSSASASALDVLHRWEQALGGADCRDCARKLDDATARLRDLVTFLPLKDLRQADTPMEGTTWFMSSLNDTYEEEEPQYLRFPSVASNGRLLCLAGHDTQDGTRNAYALAWRDALPRGATLLPGLTFVSDTYYDYENLWHGLAAVMPFFRWHIRGGCVRPARWMLYHRGELRTAMGYWVRSLAEVALGQQVRMEDLAAMGGKPACFEEAVVFRHNEGVMSARRAGEVYDMVRCKARAFCNVTSGEEEGGGGGEKGGAPPIIRMTLLLRTGARSFKNDSAVIDVFQAACGRFEGCRFSVAWANHLKTFCDQVRMLSATDVLLSPHGAQMTNLIFMDRNSSIMEFFPKGWLELAGQGQYVFRWLAVKAGMRHLGAWRDPDGLHCPFPTEEYSRCFHPYFKDQQLGHDEAHFANWTAAALSQMKESKLREASTGGVGGGGQAWRPHPDRCPCA